MPAKVTCIVLCYNGIELTIPCLETLLQQTYQPLDILVVDSASQDNTVATVRQQFPQVGLIASPNNLGYVAGNNLGIKTALDLGAENIFLVNNDTLLDPDCVTHLVEGIENRHQVGIIGPMVYTFDEGCTISSAGGEIDWRKADSRNVGIGQIDQGQYPAQKVDFINGCGLMVTKSAVQKVGILDQRYFMYWEETDWCTRVGKAGFDVFFYPQAHMRHKAPIVSTELSPMTTYYMARNRLLFFTIHTPWRQKPLTLAYALNGLLKGIRQARAEGRFRQAKATQMALYHALQGRWGQTDPNLWK
jgi:GT2 family glycosyltransferase